MQQTTVEPSEPATSRAAHHDARRLSRLAQGVAGSEILKIASEIRAMVASGKPVCNLTVGDFGPTEFRPPEFLQEQITQAIRRGETNYPPSDGILPLRTAVGDFYRRTLRLDYPLDSIVIHGGARPGIYGVYRAVVDPGDAVVYPIPSWNNSYYCHLVGAEERPVLCNPADSFLPRAEALKQAVKGARLLALNSPANPTGTTFTRSALEEICDLVLEENAGRGTTGRPLYILYDQVYWMLTFGAARHHDPVSLRPALAPYTLYVDGISKGFASTGVRVGWTVGPADVVRAAGAILSHVGAWAPKAEQSATAALLQNQNEIDSYISNLRSGLQKRLEALHNGLTALSRQGFPVTSIEPMGAMFLSVQFPLTGKRTQSGRTLMTSEDMRTYLLSEAQMAIVPFHAFGSAAAVDWFRLSVGAVSEKDIHDMFPRLQRALEGLV